MTPKPRPPLKVLFLTRYPVEGASSRYRVHQYVPQLEALGVRCTVQSFMDEAMYRLSFTPGRTARKAWMTLQATVRRWRALLRWREYDLIYMQRELFPFGPPWAERWLRRRGAALLFDYDDALFIKKPSRYNPLATLLRSPSKTLDIFRLVDCVVAGNDWLRDRAIAEGGQAVTLEVAEDTQRIAMHAPHSNDRPVTVGWLGSKSTVKYLRLIEPVLQDLARAHPGLRFEIVGGGEFEMAGVPWVHTEWGLDAELEALRRFDIGLMPLPQEDWANGKSGGKARTYMAAGVVPVCQDIGYNRQLIRPGETGFLCTTATEWREALERLIADAALRQRVAEAARADVELRFSLAGQAAALRAVFDRVVSTTPAVVMGLSPTGLYAVRELGRAGVPVLGVTREWQPGCTSKHLSACIVEPDEARRLERLMAHFPADTPRPVLIPTSDQDIEFIARHADLLSQRFVFQPSYAQDLIQTLLTKERFYALCEAEGVAYPRLWRCLPGELAGLRDQIAYPCMVKPSRIHDVKSLMAGQKGWIAEDAAAFDRLRAQIPAAAGVLLLQEIVPGPESAITLHATYVDRSGAFRQPISARKLRQYPPGFGSASLVVSAPEDGSRDIARRLLGALGYRGIAAAEFKRDPRDGRLKVIEINARPSLWFALATGAGQRLTLAAYHDLAGTGQSLPENAQTDGVVWRYAFKDMYSALFYRFRKGFVLPPPDTAVVGGVRRRVHPVFAADDPLPMLAEWWHFVRKALARLGRKAGLGGGGRA